MAGRGTGVVEVFQNDGTCCVVFCGEGDKNLTIFAVFPCGIPYTIHVDLSVLHGSVGFIEQKELITEATVVILVLELLKL